MKTVTLLALLLGILTSAHAQNSSSSTGGRKIVTLRNGNLLIGYVVKDGRDSLILKVAAGERAVALADIALIRDEKTGKNERNLKRQEQMDAAPMILATNQTYFTEEIPHSTTAFLSSNLMTGGTLLFNTSNGWHSNFSINLLPLSGMSKNYSDVFFDASLGKELLRRQKVTLDVEASFHTDEYFKNGSISLGFKNHAGPVFFSAKTGMGYAEFGVFGSHSGGTNSILGNDRARSLSGAGSIAIRVSQKVNVYAEGSGVTVPNWDTQFYNVGAGLVVHAGRFKFRPGFNQVIFETSVVNSVKYNFITPRLEVGFTF